MTARPDVRVLDHREPEERNRPFLPGMGRAWLMPFYDAFSRVAGVRELHERAVEVAGIESGQRVVDVGCGTGNLSFAVLAARPDARVTGLDPDGDSLRRAARKARRRRVPMTLVHGYADRIPAEDASFDHVVSSLALHHVDDDGRVAFAHEAFRALRPGGMVTIVDFAGSASSADDAGHDAHDHGAAHAIRHLFSLMRPRSAPKPIAKDFGTGIVTLLAEAGFADVREVDHVDHRFGRVTFIRATRAEPAAPNHPQS